MWEINIGSQAQGFLYSLVLGGLLCLVYDVIRALRLTGKSGAVAVFFEDIIFWLICTFTVFCFLMGVTGGQVRGYVLFGALAGFLAFRFTVSAVLMFVLKKIFRAGRAAKRRINAFSARILLCFNQKMDKSVISLQKFSKKIIKLLKKLLKKGKRLLYTKHTYKKKADVKGQGGV